MGSSKLARLSLLLPAAIGVSLAASHSVEAYQVSAGDYASKIATALAAGDFSGAASATERLRGCGVTSIVVDGKSTSLDEIDKAEFGGHLSSALMGSKASFVVGSIDKASVDCTVAPEPKVVKPDMADLSVTGSGTAEIISPSST